MEKMATDWSAFASGFLARADASRALADPAEVETFVRLDIGKRLSAAEKSAITLALHRGNTLALEYNKSHSTVIREAAIDASRLILRHPREIIFDLVRCCALDVVTAQKMTQVWPAGR
jgi:hypothetical protein